MVDLLDDLDAGGGREESVPAELTTVVIVGGTVEGIGTAWDVVAFGDLDGGDLEVVLGLAGSVGAKDEAVGCVRFVGVPGRRIGEEDWERRGRRTYCSLSGSH